MKELSIEEKAKAYDALFVKAQRIYNKENDVLILHTIEDLFPELAESDDERIRKALLEMVHDTTGDELWVDYGVHKEDALSWLEKQCEHANFRNKIQIGDKVTRNRDGVLVNLSQLNRVAKKDEKQGEQKPTDKVEQKGMNIVEEDMTPFQKKVFCIIDTAIEEEQGLKQVCDELLRLAHEEIIQNPAWSEDDERMWLSVLQDLQNIKDCHPKVNVEPEFNWLKSLKDKLQPQQKQEWSKEDVNFIEATIGLLNLVTPIDAASWGKSRLDCVDWLKSLRPQSTWKPSDEQMNNK